MLFAQFSEDHSSRRTSTGCKLSALLATDEAVISAMQSSTTPSNRSPVADPARLKPFFLPRIGGAALQGVPDARLKLLGAARSLREGVLPITFEAVSADKARGLPLAVGTCRTRRRAARESAEVAANSQAMRTLPPEL